MRNVNSCIQPHAENILHPHTERSCRARCKGYHPKLCKYSRATRECYNNRCFRIHLKGTRRKQTPPATQELSTTPRTTNQQQAVIKTQNLAHNHSPPSIPLPLTLAPTNSFPRATHYLTTHQTTVPLYPNPPPIHAINYTTSPSSTPTRSLHPPQTSALTPQKHYPTVPHIIISPQSHTPHLNTHDGHQ